MLHIEMFSHPAYIPQNATNFVQHRLTDFCCFFACFSSIEMGPLTAIICLAALIHQTDGQVGPVLLNRPAPGRVSLHQGRDLKQKKR